MLVNLTPKNQTKIEELARQTGRTAFDLMNEAVERMLPADTAPDCVWKKSWRRAAGIWKGREDLDLDVIRRSWERGSVPANANSLTELTQ